MFTCRHQSAYTTIEMLIAGCMLAILLASALPGLRDWIERVRADDAQKQLFSLLAYARDAAVTSGTMVTVCGSSDLAHCDAGWDVAVLVFSDPDADAEPDPDEPILRVGTWSADTRVSWRSFRNRPWLQFTPLGFTNHQSGSFTLCPRAGYTRPARQVVLSASGRTRVARDSDGDGVVEDTAGKPVAC